MDVREAAHGSGELLSLCCILSWLSFIRCTRKAMADLQLQLEEMRKLWEEERQAKQRALLELDVIRSSGVNANIPTGANVQQVHLNPDFDIPVPTDTKRPEHTF